MSHRAALRLSWAIAGSALPCLVPTAALAQQAAPSANATNGVDSVARAEAIATRAFARYRAGDHLEAVALYLEAYDASPSADALYNVARLYDRHLHDPELAMELYRRVVLEPGVDAERVTSASERLGVLRREAARQRQSRLGECGASASAAGHEPGASGSWSPLQQTGAGLSLVGLAALGAGLGFGVTALTDDPPDGRSQSALLATLSLSAAGVLIAAGGSLLLWGDADPGDEAGPVDEAARSQLRLVGGVTPGGAAVGLSGAF
jgi:tetratricopeptide (TPR) repeat protein